MIEFMDYVDVMPFAEFIGLLSIFFALALFSVHVLYFIFLLVRNRAK